MSSVRARLKGLLPRSYHERHGYLYLISQYLQGSNAKDMDMLQGAYGSPPLSDPEVLRQTITLHELRKAGAPNWSIHEGYSTPNLEPATFPPSAKSAVVCLQNVNARPIEVTQLTNVLVANRDGWVRTDEGRWITDLYPAASFHLMNAFPAMRAAAETTSRPLSGTTALLVSENASNYYHWLHQIVPQIDAIRSAGVRVDRWLVRDLRPAFVGEFLDAMGLDRDRVEEIGEVPVSCETLLVSTIPNMGALDYESGAWPLPLLRGLFLPKEPIRPWRRVYLRRDDNDSRPTLNIDAVDALLRERDFETRSMNGLTVAEQARLMAETAILVAPHGAGLANIVFCAPGTRMIEMLTRQWPSPLYGMVAASCGVRHAFVPGSEVCIPALQVRQGFAATRVPIEALRAALDAAEEGVAKQSATGAGEEP